jgi:hypothetical protein
MPDAHLHHMHRPVVWCSQVRPAQSPPELPQRRKNSGIHTDGRPSHILPHLQPAPLDLWPEPRLQPPDPELAPVPGDAPIVKSATRGEYVAASMASDDDLFCRNLLREFGITSSHSTACRQLYRSEYSSPWKSRSENQIPSSSLALGARETRGGYYSGGVGSHRQ